MYHFHMYKGVQEDVSDVSSQLCSYIHYNKMYSMQKKEKFKRRCLFYVHEYEVR